MNEGEHAWSVCWFPGVVVAPFGSVSKERDIPKSRRGLLVPFPSVPWEVLDKPIFEDPIEGGLLAWSLQVLGHFEDHSMSFLGENPDMAEVRCGDGEGLVGGGLDAPVGRDFLKFHHIGLTWGGFEHEIDLV